LQEFIIMRKSFHALCILIFTYFNSCMYGMDPTSLYELRRTGKENPIQSYQIFPDELIAYIAGFCNPCEKNLLMKICKAFNVCLKKRELILLVNPLTVSWRDKEKGMFTCAHSGDAKNLSIWLHWLKLSEGYVNVTNSLGLTSFHIASDNNYEDAMRLLVEYGADVNMPKPQIRPLHKAIYEGNKKQVETLLALKADPNLSLKNGMTPLGIAIDGGYSEIVALLCMYGAELDSTNSIFTPLYFASQSGQIEIVRFFIDSKVNVDQVSANGWTPLHINAVNLRI